MIKELAKPEITTQPNDQASPSDTNLYTCSKKLFCVCMWS